MTNDEPKKIWAQQTAGTTPVSPEGVWKVAQASERFEHTIFWRDTQGMDRHDCGGGLFLLRRVLS